MNKIRLFLIVLSLFALFIATPTEAKSSKGRAKMCWVCNGISAYAYHSNKNCRGLGRCTGSINKITIAQAKKKNHANYVVFAMAKSVNK
jgi:hypothetical protein